MKFKRSIAVAIAAGLMGFTGCASQPMNNSTRVDRTGRVSRSIRYSSHNAPYYGAATTGLYTPNNTDLNNTRSMGISRKATGLATTHNSGRDLGYNTINNDSSLARGANHTRNMSARRNVRAARTAVRNAAPIGAGYTINRANTATLTNPAVSPTRGLKLSNAPLGNKPATTVAAPRAAAKPAATRTHKPVKRSTSAKRAHAVKPAAKPSAVTHKRVASKPSTHAARSQPKKAVHQSGAQHKPVNTNTHRNTNVTKHGHSVAINRDTAGTSLNSTTGNTITPNHNTGSSLNSTTPGVRNATLNTTQNGNMHLQNNGNPGQHNPYINYGISHSSGYGLNRVANTGDATVKRRAATRAGIPVDNATRSLSLNQQRNRNQNVARVNPDGTINNRVKSLEDIGINSNQTTTSGANAHNTHNNPYINYGISHSSGYGLNRVANTGDATVKRRAATRAGIPVDNATRSLSLNQQRNRNQNVARVNPDGTINNRVKSLEDIGLSPAKAITKNAGNTRRARPQNAKARTHDYAAARRAARRELSEYRNKNVNNKTSTTKHGKSNRQMREHAIYRIDDTIGSTANLQHTLHRGESNDVSGLTAYRDIMSAKTI